MMQNDPKLFTGAAQYYAKYRPGYKPEFFDFVAHSFGLNGTGRLLDLGCGTGQLAIPLAKYFEEVVGLDPEQDMLDEAVKQAEKIGVKNIKWVLGKAEDIGKDLGPFRLTTLGASFHWMQQKEVIEKIYNLTESGGGVVIVYNAADSIGWNYESLEGWKKVRRDTIKKFLGGKRRAGNSFYQEPKEKSEDLLDHSPFGGHELWSHEYTRIWNIETIRGFLYSTAFAAPRLFGDKLKKFEETLKTELLKLEPRGIFKEQARIEVVLARK